MFVIQQYQHETPACGEVFMHGSTKSYKISQAAIYEPNPASSREVIALLYEENVMKIPSTSVPILRRMRKILVISY